MGHHTFRRFTTIRVTTGKAEKGNTVLAALNANRARGTKREARQRLSAKRGFHLTANRVWRRVLNLEFKRGLKGLARARITERVPIATMNTKRGPIGFSLRRVTQFNPFSRGEPNGNIKTATEVVSPRTDGFFSKGAKGGLILENRRHFRSSNVSQLGPNAKYFNIIRPTPLRHFINNE